MQIILLALVAALFPGSLLAEPKIERFYNHTPYEVVIALGGSWSERESRGDFGNYHQVSHGWYIIPPNYFKDIPEYADFTIDGRKYENQHSEHILVTINVGKTKVVVSDPNNGRGEKYVTSSNRFFFSAKDSNDALHAYAGLKAQQGSPNTNVYLFQEKKAYRDPNRPLEYHIGSPGHPLHRQIQDALEQNKPFGNQFITVVNQTGKAMEFRVGAQLLSLNGAGVTFEESHRIEHGKHASFTVQSSIGKGPDVAQKSDTSYFIQVSGKDEQGNYHTWGNDSYFSQRNKTLSKNYYSLGDGKRYVNYTVIVK